MLESRFYQCLGNKKTDLKGFLLKGLCDIDFYKSVVKENCPKTMGYYFPLSLIAA